MDYHIYKKSKTVILHGIVVITSACHAGNLGSIPSGGELILTLLFCYIIKCVILLFKLYNMIDMLEIVI